MIQQAITEEQHVHDDWYKEAKSLKAEQLPEFIRKLREDYAHDYGTICHAVAAVALAGGHVMSEWAGITGFQAGAVMWEFITHWMPEYKDKPLKLVDYENMLYPQYEEKFEKRISAETWEWLQEQARKHLAKWEAAPNVKGEDEEGNEVEIPRVAGPVVQHWQGIAGGMIPFGYRLKGDDE